ncbi:MAG TPA: hypothetical protein VF874_22185 [Mycobacterium sp.]
MRNDPASAATIPRWLRFVLISDRAGSSWYVGTGFFFAPVLAVVSPWPTVTAILWVLIGLAGLWLGLLGIAMAMGLAMVLRAGVEIPEEYWWSILDDSRAASLPPEPQPRRIAARGIRAPALCGPLCRRQ